MSLYDAAEEASTPATPSAGRQVIYPKAGGWYYKDSAGNEYNVAHILAGVLDISGAGEGQIKFPATQNSSANANTLDDYEEGVFTPVVEGITTAGVGTYTAQSGSYTKIGRKVQFQLVVDITAHTGTGNMRITGMPFTPTGIGAPLAHYESNLALSAGNVLMPLLTLSGPIILYQTPTGGGGAVNVPMDTAFTLYLSGSYMA